MSKEYVQSTIKIIKCFEDEEFDELFKLVSETEYAREWSDYGNMQREEFDSLFSGEERYIELKGSIPNGLDEGLELYLTEKGVPFTRWSEAGIEFDHELVVFDGVRKHTVVSSKDEEPMVEMSVLKTMLDRLEEEDNPNDDLAELKTFADILGIANYHWINTDINKFFRYGSESTVAFSPNLKKDDGVIDVEADNVKEISGDNG